MGKTYVYVGNWTVKTKGAPGGISAYEYDEGTGALKFIETVRGDLASGMLCIDRKRGVLYSIDEKLDSEQFGMLGGGGRIAAFSIDPETGKIRDLGEEQPTFSTLTTYLAMDGTGKWMVVANHGDKQAVTKAVRSEDGTYHVTTDFSDVTAVLYPVAEDGSLLPAVDVMKFPPDYTFCPAHLACLHFVQFAPDGEHFMMTNMKQSRLLLGCVDRENGRLVIKGTLTCREGNWPRYGTFHPTKKLFYLNNEHGMEINVIRYSENGGMDQIQTVTAEPEFFLDRTGKRPLQQTDIHISRDGRYLYGALRGGGVINVYAVDEESGEIERIQSMKLPGEAPRGFEIAPDGRFLLVGDPEAHTITTVAIGEDGKLSLTDQLDENTLCPAPFCFYQAG